jgi:hypothetical protein
VLLATGLADDGPRGRLALAAFAEAAQVLGHADLARAAAAELAWRSRRALTSLPDRRFVDYGGCE